MTTNPEPWWPLAFDAGGYCLISMANGVAACVSTTAGDDRFVDPGHIHETFVTHLHDGKAVACRRFNDELELKCYLISLSLLPRR